MAIETRSATKRRVLEAAKEIEMGWGEWLIYKLKCMLDSSFNCLKAHSTLFVILLVLSLILAVVLLEFPSITEQIMARIPT